VEAMALSEGGLSRIDQLQSRTVARAPRLGEKSKTNPAGAAELVLERRGFKSTGLGS
jgi:hypothetical protein